jgi:DTW domain-containing protein YfiP
MPMPSNAALVREKCRRPAAHESMTSEKQKLRPTRQRPARGSGNKQIDLEALRSTLDPRRHSSRERGAAVACAENGAPLERPFCYRCHKAAVVCLCDRVRVVSNQTGIVIFQHPRERFHPLGTSRIASLCLERCQILEARGDSGGIARPFDPPPRTGLLYPGTGSTPLEALPKDELPEHLVVLDGTWAHAHSLYRDNAWLRELPHYGLTPAEPGRYRIRSEPRVQCVSTVESIVYALRIIEPKTTGLSHLLSVFDSMIDDQIRFMA